MYMTLSSIGCRKTSRTWRRHSGRASRGKMLSRVSDLPASTPSPLDYTFRPGVP
jgi:hypothetical protein